MPLDVERDAADALLRRRCHAITRRLLPFAPARHAADAA